MKAAIYLRVSTKDQSFDSQRIDTERVARSRGYDPIFFEDQISGAKSSRQGLDAMMEGVRRRAYDAVICFKLERLGRSLPPLAQIIGELDSCGVGLIVCGQGIDTTDSNPAARLQMHVLMAVAEFERSMIRDRTKAGLEAARRKGKTLGRPKGATGIPDQRRKLAERILRENPELSCPKLARAAGISTGTAHKWKRELVSISSE